jgi:deoxyuridine 5'-triphosphate nucleotidohydrolase
MDFENDDNKRQKIVIRDYSGIIEEVNFNESHKDYFDGLKHIPRDDNFTKDYIRGLFDSEHGEFHEDYVSITFNNVDLGISFVGNINVKCRCETIAKLGENPSHTFVVYFHGHNIIDFLGMIYPSTAIVCNNTKYTMYKKMIAFGEDDCGVFKVQRTLPDAVMPSKSNASDMGFDLTIVKKIKEVGDVSFYDTGLVIQPSLGYYCMLFPRSSISKTGYMLANGIGLIDSGFTGNFIVALRKVDKDADDIVLPCRIAQLVPQKCYYPDMIEVETVEDTARGSGGFGSSGN